MAKSTRIITDGAGQELSAQLDNVVAELNGEDTSSVSSSGYTSKDILSEESGRSIAAKVGDIVSAMDAHAPSFYGTCATAAATTAKVVTCAGFKLKAGRRIAVKFTYANTASAPTLNVNSTGAVAIKSYGTTAGTLTYLWNPLAIVEFVYDGTNWIMQEPSVATSTYYGVVKATTLNGSSTTAPSFYAPTSAGTSGYVLKSNGSGAPTWVALATLTTDYVLPAASSTELGGVMLGSDTVQTVAANSVSSTSSRTYAVQVNSSGQAVVNVPWTNTNTTYSAGTGLSLSGTTFNHSNSVTAGTVGSSSAATLTYGGTFTVPYVTYDAQGHITATGTRTLTMPSSDNTDTKVTQTAVTASASYPLLLAPSGQTATTTTTACFDSGVTLNPSTNTIAANISGNAATATALGTSTVGSSTQPIYLNAGTATASSSTVGSSTKPVYLSSGTITAASSTVGGAAKPVYMSSGTVTACSSTVGSGTKPVYMSSGTITASSSSVGDANTPVYMSSGTVTAGVPNNLEDMSWSQISALCTAGKAASIFHVGQEKKISLSTGESVTAVILGFNHDDLASSDSSYNGDTGKAAITWGLKNCLKTTYAMNSSSTNSGGWGSSNMRSTYMSTFKGYLHSELQSAIRSVTKKTSAGSLSTTINSTTDDLFLFSHVEVFGTNYQRQGDGVSAFSVAGEGKQYDYYKGKTWCSYYSKTTVDSFGKAGTFAANYYYQENGYKGLGDTATSANTWWLRSPGASGSDTFCGVGSDGSVSVGNAYYAYGVCFGFCT